MSKKLVKHPFKHSFNASIVLEDDGTVVESGKYNSTEAVDEARYYADDNMHEGDSMVLGIYRLVKVIMVEKKTITNILKI